MKHGLGIMLLLWPLALLAEQTVVVSDVLPINVREGAGTGFAIVAAVKSGQRLTVLDSKPGYYKVRTPKGNVGWVLARFVQDEPVARELLAIAQQQRDAALQQAAEQSAQLQALSQRHEQAQTELDDTRAREASLQLELSQLRELAQEPLALQRRNDELEQALSGLRKQHQGLQDQTEQRGALRSHMLLGAGLLLVGLLLGLIIPLLRPRTSSWS